MRKHQLSFLPPNHPWNPHVSSGNWHVCLVQPTIYFHRGWTPIFHWRTLHVDKLNPDVFIAQTTFDHPCSPVKLSSTPIFTSKIHHFHCFNLGKSRKIRHVPSCSMFFSRKNGGFPTCFTRKSQRFATECHRGKAWSRTWWPWAQPYTAAPGATARGRPRRCRDSPAAWEKATWWTWWFYVISVISYIKKK